jgi:thiosulfate dehydrogenase [quinone] large subunit
VFFLLKIIIKNMKWGLTRISMGFMFLWAFFDKLLGLGRATPIERAWISGGSPTAGFLSNTKGTYADFFHSLAGVSWVDPLFMAGLFFIGAALFLGIGMRIASITGAILLVLMYTAELPLPNNPLVDEHIIYALVLFGLAGVEAGRFYGLGNWWSNTKLVRKLRILE